MIESMLHRIGYRTRVAGDLDTFVGLHRAWRRSVPYENVDIQLGLPIRLDPEVIFDKLIRRRRGGYCFEQNEGLAALLRLAGFRVTLVEGAVLRAARGEEMWGNHSTLLVDLDGVTWLADAGIGDGFVSPLPLREGSHRQGDLHYRLERLDRETWRFHHTPGGTIASYDFRLEPRELSDFEARSDELSTSPTSAYRTMLMAARPVGDRTEFLLSRTLRRLGPGGTTRTIEDQDDLARTLADVFLVPVDDLGPGGVRQLWRQAEAQHARWLART